MMERKRKETKAILLERVPIAVHRALQISAIEAGIPLYKYVIEILRRVTHGK